MVVIREPGRRGVRAEKPERGNILSTQRCACSKFQRVGPETEKTRVPSLVLIRDTLNLFVLFDCRCFTEKQEG